MDDAKKQLADKLKDANNILVTVSRNPSVDQLAACIGLTLLLDKQGKHAVSVFSGTVPSTLEFLEPDKTLEKTTDSLRDFIISLDKNKADKLRYKVEDNVVRIFITPYKTSIGQEDFEFSQGDFNVDVIVALGVREQEDLDQAITAHGRILHDATLTSINTTNEGDLGVINWRDPQASSLSELVTELAQAMGKDLLDTQIATALLTGIVAETGRFSNDKTSSETMNMSAVLMTAGANQQLVASKLEQNPQPGAAPGSTNQSGEVSGNPPAVDDGLIAIDHQAGQGDLLLNQASPPPVPTQFAPPPQASAFQPPPPPPPSASPLPEYKLPPAGPQPSFVPPAAPSPGSPMTPGARMMTGPPSLGGTLTANSRPEALEPTTDPFSLPKVDPPQLLNRKPAPPPSAAPVQPSPPPPPSAPTPDTGHTLAELEADIKSSHATSPPVSPPVAGLENLNAARDEVSRALSGSSASLTATPEPIEALGAQPLGNDLHPPVTPAVPSQPAVDQSSAAPGPTLDEILSHTEPDTPAASPKVTDPNAPPPVPPPIPFQFGNTPPPQ